MGRNLSTLFISQSYQFLTQISGSELQDGLGNTITGSLAITSSQAISASFATTASFALNAGTTVSTASLLTTASAVNNVITFTKGDASTFNVTVDTGSATTVNTGSLMVTGSATNNVLTFTKGDGSTFALTVATGSGAVVNTGSLLVTASISNATTTFTKGDGSTFSITANNVVNADSASLAANATSASFATTATSASFATTATSASFATSASQAQNAVSASFASTSSITISSSFATTASLALNNVLTASSNNDTITFTKGDGTTFTNVINNVSASISSSFATNATSASFASTAISASQAANATTASFAETIASGLSPTFLNATASNVLITGTASVNVLITNIVSSSVIFSSGSNILGDSATLDTQTLIGVVTTSGSLQVTGSADFADGITGSLLGTASFAVSASQAQNAVSASFAPSTPTFPFTGSAIISGSLEITGSISTTPPTASGFINNIGRVLFETGFDPGPGAYRDFLYSSTSDFAIGTAGYKEAIRMFPSEVVVQIPFRVGSTALFQGDTTIGDSLSDTHKITGSLNTTGSVNIFGGLIQGTNNTLSGSTGLDAAILATSASFIFDKDDAFRGTSIIGGDLNTIKNKSGTTLTGERTGFGIFGGSSNTINVGGNSSQNNIFGGQSNTISSDYGGVTIVGGEGNSISANSRATIIAGQNNSISSDYGILFGGLYNQVNGGYYSPLLGGTNNRMNGGNGTAILAGEENIMGATTDFSTIIGGRNNVIATNASRSAIIGGFGNNLSGKSSVMIGMTSASGSADNTVYVPNLVVSGSLTATNATTFVQNTTDTYTSSAAVQQVVTLTQAEYNAIGSPDANTLYLISGSTPINTSIFATTGSNTFTGNQIISGSLTVTGSTTLQSTIITGSLSINGSQVITGSLRGNVGALSISSNTASLDCSTGNFFTLLLVSGSDTFVNPSNINSGQTINLRVKQASVASGSISFASSVLQVSGSAYTPTATANGEDIVTFISFDSTNLYLSNIKNFV